MTTKIVGIKEFRARIASFVKQGRQEQCRYIVLNRNKPAFEVRTLDPNEMILEKFIENISRARREVKAGKVTKLENALKEFGL